MVIKYKEYKKPDKSKICISRYKVYSNKKYWNNCNNFSRKDLVCSYEDMTECPDFSNKFMIHREKKILKLYNKLTEEFVKNDGSIKI